MIIVGSGAPSVGWVVELDADPDTTGQFMVGSSLLGSVATVAPDERWIAVPTLRVQSISVRRGGGQANRAYDAGECVVVLDNSSGDFDPDNSDSFYVMGPRQLVTQGTGLRVKATGTTETVLFTGRLGGDGIVLGGHWAAPTATLTATDLLADLADVDVPAQGGQTGSGESSSVRAHWLLDQAGVPTAKRSIQAAGRQCLGTTGGGTVREALDQVANGEAGRFFVNRTGVVTLTWHDAEYGKSSQIDYANTGTNPKYVSIQSSTGAAGVTNTAVVKRIVPKVRNEDTGQFEDGPDLDDAGATDWESVAAYGTRSVTVEVVLQNDGDVTELASFLANRRAQPIPRITELVSVPLEAMTADQAQSVLEADLGDLITLSQRTIDGRVRDWAATIENIAFDHSSPMTTVKFATAPSDTAAYDAAGWFLIGSSLLGGADVLAPF